MYEQPSKLKLTSVEGTQVFLKRFLMGFVPSYEINNQVIRIFFYTPTIFYRLIPEVGCRPGSSSRRPMWNRVFIQLLLEQVPQYIYI